MPPEALEPEALIQVRELPLLRAVKRRYLGPAAGIGPVIEKLSLFALEQAIGPSGATVAIFPRLIDPQTATLGGHIEIEADLLVPVHRLGSAADGNEMIELPRCQAACLLYTGPLDQRFRDEHHRLFAWMDARGIPRAGTIHQHAYVGGTSNTGSTVEIRIPVIGSQAPLPAM